MLAGIRDILIISTPRIAALRAVAGRRHADRHPLSLRGAARSPKDSRRRSSSAREFIGGDPVCLVLGDNIFYGHGLTELLKRAAGAQDRRHGVRLSGRGPRALRRGRVRCTTGKRYQHRGKAAASRKSHYAVTGLYFYDTRSSRSRRA